MYLSKLVLDLRSKASRADLGDRYEFHRTIMSAFPAEVPETERVLFRVEVSPYRPTADVLVQSQGLPDWERSERLQLPHYLRQPVSVRQITPEVRNGQRLRFRLQANPTVKRDAKRHALESDADLQLWLERKAGDHGFAVNAADMLIVRLGKVFGRRREQTWSAVQFDGVLQVIDHDRFEETLRKGIGSAKGFGFGLLSIPYPAMTTRVT